jgi:hypothetical protein
VRAEKCAGRWLHVPLPQQDSHACCASSSAQRPG